MLYEESYTQFDTGLLEYIKSTIPASFASALQARGTAFVSPQDLGLELKLKYEVDGESGKFSLKFTWDNETGVKEDDEDD